MMLYLQLVLGLAAASLVTAHPTGRCGDGIVDPGEECDEGPTNGAPGSLCSAKCKKLDPPKFCGNGVVEAGEACDDGLKNGTPESNCTADCKVKTPVAQCAVCDPNPLNNKCTVTTSCITAPDNKNHYCACRAGYRADGLQPTDAKQFRLAWPGQEYRVFVAPGVECNTLCNAWWAGPDSCSEVPVRKC